MPHQCTNCEYLVEDGSQEMLSGCPECDGNKFQFRPGGWEPREDEEGEAAAVESQENGGDEIIDASESTAQSTARSEVVSSSDMPSVSAWPGESEMVEQETVESSAGEESEPEDPYEREAWKEEQKAEVSLDALRQELNRQFESIKIMSPGEYELNLMELYENEERIIALQEDGQYMIEVPNYLDDE